MHRAKNNKKQRLQNEQTKTVLKKKNHTSAQIITTNIKWCCTVYFYHQL